MTDETPEGFARHGLSTIEPLVGDLGGGITPVERFFVCTTTETQHVDRDGWTLTVDGDAAGAARTFTITDLTELDTHVVPAWLECAGNGRQLFEIVDGHPSGGGDGFDTQWMLGAMGQAVWSGVRLRDVLDLVGVDPSATVVGTHGPDPDGETLEGVDDHVAMNLPIDKALDPDTIIATHMNGEPLPAEHGAPARLVVPGWIGTYWVKWLERLEVSSHPVRTWRGEEYYVHRTPDGVKGEPVTAHPVKSTLALPWEAELAEGPRTFRGYARSGSAEITKVEVAVDDGPWFAVAMTPTYGRWAWSLFEFQADLEPGDHVIRTRAHDATGAMQPDSQPYHPNTILWHTVTPHPIRILPGG